MDEQLKAAFEAWLKESYLRGMKDADKTDLLDGGFPEKALCSDCGEDHEGDCSKDQPVDPDSPSKYLTVEDLEKYRKVYSAKKKTASFFKEMGSGLTSEMPVTFVKAKGDDAEVGVTRDKYRPTAKQLKLINKVALEDQETNSGFVIPFQATNKYNEVDRGLQRLKDKGLNTLAKNAVKNAIPYLVSSKSDCEDHTWKAINAYGFCIEAWTKDGGLFYNMYIPDNDETRPILTRMFSGMINKLSIGFSLAWADVTCDSCNKQMYGDECPHELGDIDEKGRVVTSSIEDTADNFEISGVAVPCQAAAKTIRVDSPDNTAKKSAADFGRAIANLGKAIQNQPILTASGLGIGDLNAVDKMVNGKDTIEDNKSMDVPENKEVETKTESLTPVVEAEVKTAPKETTVVTSADEQLCKVAEQVKTQAVAEIKALLEAQKAPEVDLTEVLSSLKSIKEEIEGLKSMKAELKADLEAMKAEIKKDVAVAATVPVKTVTDAAGMTSAKAALDVAPDGLLGAFAYNQ